MMDLSIFLISSFLMYTLRYQTEGCLQLRAEKPLQGHWFHSSFFNFPFEGIRIMGIFLSHEVTNSNSINSKHFPNCAEKQQLFHKISHYPSHYFHSFPSFQDEDELLSTLFKIFLVWLHIWSNGHVPLCIWCFLFGCSHLCSFK